MTQADAIGESSRVRYVPKFPRRTTRHRPLFKISLSSDVMRLIQFTTRDIALVFHLIVKVILNYNIKFEKYNIQRLRKDFVQFDKSPTSNSVRKSVGTVFIYLFIYLFLSLRRRKRQRSQKVWRKARIFLSQSQKLWSIRLTWFNIHLINLSSLSA